MIYKTNSFSFNNIIIFFGVLLGVSGLLKLEMIIKEKVKSKKCKNTISD